MIKQMGSNIGDQMKLDYGLAYRKIYLSSQGFRILYYYKNTKFFSVSIMVKLKFHQYQVHIIPIFRGQVERNKYLKLKVISKY